MGCFCKTQLLSAAQALQNLPLAMLAKLLPAPLPTGPLGRATANLSARAAVSGSATASASAMATLAASARLNASFTASAAAKLEALANLSAQLGVNVLAPQASLRMALTIGSANQHLPLLAAALDELLGPIQGALEELVGMIASLTAAGSAAGINLLQPVTAAQLNAAVAARLAAQASLTASASASASATGSLSAAASASARLAAAARLSAAAQALGINLLAPQGIAKLNAALTVAAKLSPPPLGMPPLGVAKLAATLGQLAALKNLGPQAMANQLKGMIATLLNNANLVAGLNLSALASAKVSAQAVAAAKAALAAKATASASASASASLMASAAAAAKVNLSGPPLVPIPSFPQLNALANLSAQIPGGAMASSPCASCGFAR